jgi:hypothetical protein
MLWLGIGNAEKVQPVSEREKREEKKEGRERERDRDGNIDCAQETRHCNQLLRSSFLGIETSILEGAEKFRHREHRMVQIYQVYESSTSSVRKESLSSSQRQAT